jgi:hypothetical protein
MAGSPPALVGLAVSTLVPQLMGSRVSKGWLWQIRMLSSPDQDAALDALSGGTGLLVL